eukprot:GHRQ01030013.1.p1 GENE.GHRQ01030013.1~~GHRQ01030013.1.p1  ORF type:complete len:115 (+),score=26.71 GHRQ01030013.1:276-620(+)
MPTLLQPSTAQQKPIHLQLSNRTLIKTIKCGHPWLYADSLQSLPPAPPGSLALVKTKEGDIIAKGLYDPKSKLVFRALAVKERRLDDSLVEARLQRAVALRRRLFEGQQTTGMR